MACREGCKTKDHGSYAACLRSANPQVSATNTTSPQNDAFTQTKKDLSAYETARVNGIQPEGTSVEKVRAAEQASRHLGRSYNANVDPPTSVLVNKKTADLWNRAGAK